LAKLNLATLDRQDADSLYDTYDIELLPSRYVGNTVVLVCCNGLVEGLFVTISPGIYQRSVQVIG
jgi:hypothetical protein